MNRQTIVTIDEDGEDAATRGRTDVSFCSNMNMKDMYVVEGDII